MSIQIELDLKEILGQINQKLDKLDDKIEKLDNKVDDINGRLIKVETKLDEGITPRLDALSEQVRDIKSSQIAQIWTLIGILFTAVAGFLIAVGKFVLSGNGI